MNGTELCSLFYFYGGRKGEGATWRRSGRRRGGRGDRTYPVAYEYDHAGRMVKMTTWQSFTNPENAGGAAETHWNYNARGLLVSKRYNDNTGPDYEYYGNGRLKMRTWARQIEGQALTTSYTYNNAGDLLGINYSDATADVAFVYDRLGRKTTISDAAGTRTIGYDPVTGQPDTEVVAAGGVYGLETTLDYDYDALGRRIRLAGSLPPPTADFNGDGMVDVGDLGILSANYGRNLRQEGIPEDQWRSLGDVNNNGKVDIGDLGALSAQYGSSSSMGATHYTYDAASRLATIKDGEGGSLDNGVTYSYLQNSSLLSQAQFAVGTTAKMTTLRSFDTLNRLTSINSTPTGGSTIGYSYTYNAANQRTGQVLSDGSNWTYGYDALGQLTSAPRKFSDNVGVPGQQFTYTYDTIGNRTTASVTGETQRTVNYTANALNQYTQRSVPDEVDIAGYTAFASDTVVVNNAAPSTRRGTFYYEELDFNGANGSNAYNTTVPFKITSGDGSIVRDNSDASTEFWGTWTPSTSGTGYQGGDFLHDNNGDKGDLSALFYPSVPAVGNFSIYMRWPTWANQSSNASNLTVAISYKNGAYYTEKTVNQRQDLSASGYWYYLGNYPLSPGINDYVGYSNFDTDGYVLVDAFKFVPETLTPLPIYLAQTPEVFSYDDDGNLISDGRWQYFYDGENRLIRMESRTTVSTSRRRKLTFTYDYLGRRVKKAVYTWNTSTSAYNTSPSGGSKFVYDGWNLIAELGVSDVKLIRSCTWGQDLSGSLQGAGGIGGLVFVRQYGTEAGSYYPAYDANGNLTAMVRASDGKVAANYDYSPYGELLASGGVYATINPFRFSTKYTDSETNLAYFGYRYYNPDTGRWLNRDPMEEEGGVNLYCYVNNEPIGNTDYNGLWIFYRKKQARAEVEAELPYGGYYDTLEKLAQLTRLDPKEFQKWVQLKNDKIKTYTGPRSLQDLNSSDRICPGEKVSVPNTILTMREQLSKWVNFWHSNNIERMSEQFLDQYSASEWNIINEKDVTRTQFLALVNNKEDLAAFFFAGHGDSDHQDGTIDIPINSNDLKKTSYIMVTARNDVILHHKLSKIALWSCYSGASWPNGWKKLVSSYGSFLGHRGLIKPWTLNWSVTSRGEE